MKEEILKGDVHTIDEMWAWLKPLGYSDTINEAAINFILREFVMSKVPSGSLCNAEMIVDHLHPQLEHQTSSIIHHTSLITSSIIHQTSSILYTSSIIHKTSNIFSESIDAQMQETRWEWNREIIHFPSSILHLNDKYFKEGDTKRASIEEFNSDNTKRLNLEETKDKIASLEYIQNELNGIPNLV